MRDRLQIAVESATARVLDLHVEIVGQLAAEFGFDLDGCASRSETAEETIVHLLGR